MDDKNSKKLFTKFKFLKKKEMKIIECNDGWFNILLNLFTDIQKSNPPVDFKVTKVFDKFGELHVYTVGGNNTTRFAIENAAELASNTCGACGNAKELQMCKACVETTDPVAAAYVPDLGEQNAIVETNTSRNVFVPSSNLTDYYFMSFSDPNAPPGTPIDMFLITPKSFWDANKYIYDQHLPIEAVLSTHGFYSLDESTYEYANGTLQQGRALLLQLGLIENLNM